MTSAARPLIFLHPPPVAVDVDRFTLASSRCPDTGRKVRATGSMVHLRCCAGFPRGDFAEMTDYHPANLPGWAVRGGPLSSHVRGLDLAMPPRASHLSGRRASGTECEAGNISLCLEVVGAMAKRDVATVSFGIPVAARLRARRCDRPNPRNRLMLEADALEPLDRRLALPCKVSASSVRRTAAQSAEPDTGDETVRLPATEQRAWRPIAARPRAPRWLPRR